MQEFNKPKYGLIVLSILCYISIAFLFPRSEFNSLIIAFVGLFVAYYFFINKKWFKTEKEVITIAMVFRVIFLFSVPTLSDDFYRYLWDGQLVVDGINPFDFRPSELIEEGVYQSGILFEKMNSPDFYSVYPPTNQLFFTLSAWLGKGDWKVMLLVFKVFVLLLEFGTLITIKKISNFLGKGLTPLIIYGLNPLVIAEFSGSVHSEVIMIFFVALFVYLLLLNKWIASAVSLALAICSKLIPVLLIPLLVTKLGWRKTIQFGAVTGVCCLLMFGFLYNDTFLPHLFESLQLYFKYFEFNGLLYLGSKYVDGYWINGAKLFFKLFSLIMMLWVYLKSKNEMSGVFREGLLLFTIYFMFSSTVHPWYIAALVFYTALSDFKFLLIWTFMIVLSYKSYETEPNQSFVVLMIVEYIIVLFFLLKDFRLILTSSMPYRNLD